ncbi:MAG: hypothetical protein GYA48_07925 [Chloroflexi bacterium]|nr:hypothetical protein [Chloroflexota bacterium]
MANWLQVIRGARGWNWARAGVIAVVGLALLAGVAAAVSTSQQTWMVSNPVPDAPLEGVADGNSLFSNISYTGRWVAFESQAANLTADSDGYNDIFLYENYDDSGTRKELITEVTTGANAGSYYPNISRIDNDATDWDLTRCNSTLGEVSDGRYVAFESTSSAFSKFFAGEVDPLANANDLFIYDRGSPAGTDAICGHPEGIWAVLSADDTYDHQPPNAESGNVKAVSSVHNQPGNAHIAANPLHSGISIYMKKNIYLSDGLPRVVFESLATNLVADTNGLTPSADGQSNRHIYLKTGFLDAEPRLILLSKKTVEAPLTLANGPCTQPVVSSSGRFVAMVCKANNLVEGVTIPNGSDSKPLAQVYLLDRDFITNGTYDEELDYKWYLASQYVDPDTSATGAAGADESWYPSIAEDGQFVYVAFHSFAENLVDSYDGQASTSNAADVFVMILDKSNPAVRELYLGSRASGFNGAPGNFHSYMPSLSADGRAVAYTSLANNLVTADHNEHCGFTIDGELYTNCPDVFIRRFKVVGGEAQTWRASLSPNGVEAYYNSAFASLSGNSRFVGFSSYTDLRVDQQLRPSQLNSVHIYIRDMSETSGNPNIQPSAGYFYAFPGDSYDITFNLTFFEGDLNLTSALNLESPQGGGADAAFSIISDTCNPAETWSSGDSCAVTVRYTSPDTEYREALLSIPFSGYTRRVALFGSTIMRIFPLVSP